MKIIGGILALAAAVGFGFVPATSRPSPAQPQQIAATPVLQFQAGSLSQLGPRVVGFGQPIHVSITGTPMAGSYTAYKGPASNGEGWAVDFRGPSGIWGTVCVDREINQAGVLVWSFTAMMGTSDGNGGACTGSSSNGQVYGGLVVMSGPDFGVSGTGQFLGNPAFGGGQNITVTVSP